jgi:Bacterial Ig domain/Cadherin domain
VAENQAPGTTVGTLSTTDPDAGDTFTYTLVSGTGSDDNGSFQITGASLQTNVVLDFEQKASYQVRVRTTDQTARFFEKQFTVSVTNVNEAPSNIALAPSSIAENLPALTTIGGLSASDEDAGQTHTFSLQASGCGGGPFPDNGSFSISGNALSATASLNYEAKSSYTICVRATDNGAPALSFDKQLTVTVTNVNEAPTDIALTGSTLPENQPSGTTVGTFLTTDPDIAATHTYTLVVGTGSTDNASFTITSANLRTSAVFDFETKASYSIRVRATDAGSLFFEKAFTITVANVNEAPMNTVPGGQTVNEDTDLAFSGANALSVADPDAGTGSIQTTVSALHGTITPATGSGATITGSGTASAQITGTLTQVNAALNGLKYKGTANWNSTRGTETLTVVSNDQGNIGSGGALSDSDTVGVTVSAVNDAPSAVAKNYSAQANMKIGLTGLLTGASDPDTGDGGYTASFSVGTVSATSPAGGTVTVTNAATGAFDFDPPPGATGSVSFTYTVCDSGNPAPSACSAAATVTVSVAGPVIWFVNAASGNDTTGKGTLAAPFQTIAKVDTVDAANQAIFLYSGTYANGITLNTGELLVGQGTTGSASFDALFGISPPAGTIARPALATGTATVQGTVTLASSVVLRGLALSTATATGITGSGGLTGIDVAQVSISTTTGTAVTLNNASGSYAFTSISTNGAANGILLDTLGASSFTGGGGSIVNASTRGVDINGGSGNFSYTGTISTAGTGRSVEVTGHSGGTVTLGGAVSDSGSGINLGSNTGATMNFTGGLTLSTGANSAFIATGGGSSNSVTTTSGVAVEISGTAIGGSGFTLASMTASGAAPNGVVLAGTSGNFTVTGATTLGTAGGSGPTGAGVSITNHATGTISFGAVSIQRRGSTGIFIDNADGTSIAFGATIIPNQNNAGGYGVRIEDSSAAVSLASATIDNANVINPQSDGNSDGIPDTDGDGDAIFLINNNGSFTLNGGTLSNCGNDCIDLRSSSALGLSGVNISAPGQDVTGATGQGFGGHGIWANNLTGTSSITGATISGFNVGNRDGMNLTNSVSTPLTLTIHGTTFQNSTGNRGLGISGHGTANMTVTVGGPTDNVLTNVTFQNISGTALQSTAGGSPAGSTGMVNLTVQHTTFQNSSTDGKTNLIAGVGEAGKSNVVIQDNTFNNVMITASTGEGLISIGNDGLLSGNQLGLTLQRNTINNVGSSLSNCAGGAVRCNGPLSAILVFIDDQATVPNTLVIADNTITNVQQGGIQLDMANAGANASNVAARITSNCVGKLRSGTTCTGADARVGVGVGATNYFGIRVERRRAGAKTANVLIDGNTVRAGNGTNQGALNTPAIFARTQADTTMALTATGNNVDTSMLSAAEMRFITNSPVIGDPTTPTMCTDVNANAFPAGAAAEIRFDENVGTLNVEQASSAALAGANGGANVNVAAGTPSFGVACAAPPP